MTTQAWSLPALHGELAVQSGRRPCEVLHKSDIPAARASVRPAESRDTRSAGSGRSGWVRLGSQSLYEQAIAAHRSRQPVRAQGELSTLGARIELIVGADGFGLLG